MQAKLQHWLHQPEVNCLSLQRLLDKVEDRKMCLNICQGVLVQKELACKKSLLIIQYVNNNLSDLLEREDRWKLLMDKIGISSLEIIPEHFRASYEPLYAKPVLILEQLLMNVRIGIAKEVAKNIYFEAKDEELLRSLVIECDEAIAQYASKALDLAYVNADAETQRGRGKTCYEEVLPLSLSEEIKSIKRPV